VTEDDRCPNVLKDIVNFSNLRFKDRDDMEEIFSSYYKKHPFDMEKLRDQRLRHHFQERYDFRKN
jgi:dynein assembly factor 3